MLTHASENLLSYFIKTLGKSILKQAFYHFHLSQVWRGFRILTQTCFKLNIHLSISLKNYFLSPKRFADDKDHRKSTELNSRISFA